MMKAALPFGLRVPVLPGTRRATVSGAIASDLHGKNHHSAGSFGTYVVSMGLLPADGQIWRLTPGDEESPVGDGPAFVLATVGGCGLTGTIVRTTIRMTHTETAGWISHP